MHPWRRKVTGWAALGALVFSGTSLADQGSAQHRYPLPEQGDIVGQLQTVIAEHEDTLIDIGLANNLGYNAITLANPETSIWLPGEGTEVLLPTRFVLPEVPRKGLVVNIAELRLYYYPSAEPGETPSVETYPIGIGRMDWQTPLGVTHITAKLEQPAWYPPASIIAEHAENGEKLPRVVPPGPDNPLGDYAMTLAIPGYLLHSTNRPDGIGMRVSHGCIRMLPGDIENLIFRIPKGTQVRLIDQPVKFGWSGNDLLEIQAYPVKKESSKARDERIAEALDRATELANTKGFLVDYTLLKEELETPSGVARSLLLAQAPVEARRTFLDRAVLKPSLYSQLGTDVAEPSSRERSAAEPGPTPVPVEERSVSGSGRHAG